jgi:hypothetical protein
MISPCWTTRAHLVGTMTELPGFVHLSENNVNYLREEVFRLSHLESPLASPCNQLSLRLRLAGHLELARFASPVGALIRL